MNAKSLHIEQGNGHQRKLEVSTETITHLWRWVTQQNNEGIFTLITLVMLITGWLAETWEAAPIIWGSAYAVAYAAGGYFGGRAGLESLRERRIDVDLLMILAAIGAAIVGSPFEGALLLFLFSFSNVLQDYALDRTRNAIRSLMKLRPDEATIRRGSQWLKVSVETVRVKDIFLLRPGDRIPLDGTIIQGKGGVDQASITGESMPVSKQPGDQVLAGTINLNGSLQVEVTRSAQESTIARLIKLVEDARSEKAQTQRFLDTAEQYYAMGVIGFTILAVIIPIFLLNHPFDETFYRAMTLMVAASPCALIISTPASILSAIGNGARRGVLFKGGVYMEQAAGIKVVAFDKTGTLTQGKPQVTDVTLIEPGADHQAVSGERWQGSDDDLLALAAAIEAKSEHPLAQAIVMAAEARELKPAEVTDFNAEAGKGVRGQVNGYDIWIGRLDQLNGLKPVGEATAQARLDQWQAAGKTAVVVVQLLGQHEPGHILGVIALADQLRAEAAPVVKALKGLGVEQVVMLTGDNDRVAQAIAEQVGVDTYYADLLPEDKLQLIKKLEAESGSVAMIGDGVNDAPALASASIGIAMGAAGTDVALETADIVLMADDLQNLPYLIALSRQTRKTLIMNLAFAMAMIVVMVIAIFTANFSLPLAVIGHEGGTVLVSLNGLRLLLFKQQPIPGLPA